MRTQNVIKKIIFAGLILSSTQTFALVRGIAILDLATLNKDPISSTNALEQATKVAGVPYIITTDIPTATQYSMIVSSSYVPSATSYLNSTNTAILRNYVMNGGVWVASNVQLSTFTIDLFGIATATQATNRYTLFWQTGTGDKSLSYFTDPNTQTIHLDHNTASPPVAIPTRGYTLGACQTANTCLALATFDDGSAAVIKNNYGTGATYTVGASYTDVILRNLLNVDNDLGQTSWSNGFEADADVFMLFLRAIYTDRVNFGVWKHTSMYNTQATVMLTHDVDSEDAMINMNSFADLEQSLGLSATYNVTSHYFQDDLLSAFYVNYFNNFGPLLNHPGVSIQSHTVSHAPDFGKTTAFPIGAPGNNKTNYFPYVHLISTNPNVYSTTGGTVWGETETVKKTLEGDLKVPTIKTFRTGFLVFNKYQVEVLDALGYLYDSSDSANDVCTNFPFHQKYEFQLSGTTSNLWEIPMTLSDSGVNAGISATNYPTIVSGWVNVTARDAGIYAPTVLLIHPDAPFKVSAEQSYIAFLQNSAIKYYITSMEAFGDFWRARDTTNYTSTVQNNTVAINFTTGMPAPSFSLVVSNGQALQSITATGAGVPIHFSQANFGNNDVLLYSFTQ